MDVKNKEGGNTPKREKKEVTVAEKPSVPTYKLCTTKKIRNACNPGELVQTKGRLSYCEIKNPESKKYMILKIQDEFGEIEGKIWSDGIAKIPTIVMDKMTSIDEDNHLCIAVAGTRDEWLGNPYINIKGLKVIDDDPLQYIQKSTRDIDSMFDKIVEVVEDIDEPFRLLLLNKLGDNEEEFKDAPAAKRYHDNFKGGLLEHTYALLMAYLQISEMYRYINKSVMVYIIVEHDFQKIWGYKLLPTIEWTEQEELVGHQTMAAINVYNELTSVGIDDVKKMAVLNALISHHGKPEWGAAKPAMTIEARLLSHLDYMISDIAKANQIIEDNDGLEGKISKDLFYVKF